MSPEEAVFKIKRGTVEIINAQDLLRKIKTNKPLKVKVGFDPTSSDIHLGHVVLLKKLRLLQDLGHIVYFLIGDFTAMIGDPSERDTLRPKLSKEEIMKNASTYTEQAFKILDKEKTKVVFNSKWFAEMKLDLFCNLLSKYTVARLLERDDFQKRYKDNKPISMLEFVYPLLQGYDSVVLEADIELGGTDQKFNLLCARTIQETFSQEPEVIITLPLLVGLDGTNKMSKSLGNYIGITEPPEDIFGKVMSVSDELMYQWYEILTQEDMTSIKNMHPKEAKQKLAEEITSWFYSKEEAAAQKERFEKIFSKGVISDDIPEHTIPKTGKNIIELLFQVAFVTSKNEARRLIKQGAVEFDGSKISDEDFVVSGEGILRCGKKNFLKIKIK